MSFQTASNITIYKKKNRRKETRGFLANISMFLLNREELKGLLWSVKTIEYKRPDNLLRIGINSTEKLGTTLSKMRSMKKDLSDYLYYQGLTANKRVRIEFFVDREDEIIAKIYELIEGVHSKDKKKH